MCRFTYKVKKNKTQDCMLLLCLKTFPGTGWTTFCTNGLEYTSACVIQYQYTTYAQSKVVNIEMV